MNDRSGKEPKGWFARNRMWLVAAVVLAVPVAAYLCQRFGCFGHCAAGELQCTLAEMLGGEVGNGAQLYVNIPPEFSRYPGTILLSPENIRVQTTQSGDSLLDRTVAYSTQGLISRRVQASGAVVRGFLDAVTRSSVVSQIEIHVDPGRTVTADLQELYDQVNRSPVYSRLRKKDLARVINKAFEGKVTIRALLADTLSIGGFTREMDRITAEAGSLNVQFSTEGRKEVVWSFEDVYAFTTIDAQALLEGLDPVVLDAPSGPMDTAAVVRNLLAFDPIELPELEGTLREVGPGAGKELMQEIVQGDSLTRSRGTLLLKELPETAKLRVDDPAAWLQSPDPAKRGWAAVSLATSGKQEDVDRLANLLSDDTPAVRQLAAEALGNLGPDATRALSRIQDAGVDLDAGVRQAARKAQLKISTPVGQEANRAESALQSSDPSRQAAGLGLVEDIAQQDPERAAEILRMGLTSENVDVQREALRVAGDMEGLGDSLIQSVGPLQEGADQRVRDLTDVLLRRRSRPGNPPPPEQ